MIDKVKLARLVELKQTLDDTEAEIFQLLNGGNVQPPQEKSKRVRRTREQIEADERTAREAVQTTELPQAAL